MAFETIANLLSGARPYYLYSFSIDGVEYLYTNKKTDITKSVDGVTGTLWASEAISHSKIVDSDQASRSELTITFPLDNTFAFNSLNSFILRPISVKIWKGFLNDPDGDLVIQFVGRALQTVADDKGSKILFKCMTEISSLQRKGLSGVIQRPCRHPHYGRGCNLDLTDWQVELPVASISADGRSLVVTGANAQADGYYQLGIMEYNGAFEMMLTHSGNNVTLVTAIPGLQAAVVPGVTTVKIAPGCPLSREICNSRFSNVLNFGGFPFISDNPFDGRQVF